MHVALVPTSLTDSHNFQGVSSFDATTINYRDRDAIPSSAGTILLFFGNGWVWWVHAKPKHTAPGACGVYSMCTAPQGDGVLSTGR